MCVSVSFPRAKLSGAKKGIMKAIFAMILEGSISSNPSKKFKTVILCLQIK